MKYTLKNMHLLKDLKALIRTLDLTRNAEMLTSNWKKVPKLRRARVAKLHQIALSNANSALDLTGCSDGVTRTIIWGGKASAKTIQDANAGDVGFATTHVVRLELAGVLEMEKNPELLACASNRGLPIIALYRMPRNPGIFQAIWVANQGAKIKSVSGWITYDNARNITFYGG